MTKHLLVMSTAESSGIDLNPTSSVPLTPPVSILYVAFELRLPEVVTEESEFSSSFFPLDDECQEEASLESGCVGAEIGFK